MKDEHVLQISESLKEIASAIRWLGFSISLGLVYAGCMASMHH